MTDFAGLLGRVASYLLGHLFALVETITPNPRSLLLLPQNGLQHALPTEKSHAISTAQIRACSTGQMSSTATPSTTESLVEPGKMKFGYFSNEFPRGDLKDLFRRLLSHSKDRRHPLLAIFIQEATLA